MNMRLGLILRCWDAYPERETRGFPPLTSANTVHLAPAPFSLKRPDAMKTPPARSRARPSASCTHAQEKFFSPGPPPPSRRCHVPRLGPSDCLVPYPEPCPQETLGFRLFIWIFAAIPTMGTSHYLPLMDTTGLRGPAHRPASRSVDKSRREPGPNPVTMSRSLGALQQSQTLIQKQFHTPRTPQLRFIGNDNRDLTASIQLVILISHERGVEKCMIIAGKRMQRASFVVNLSRN